MINGRGPKEEEFLRDFEMESGIQGDGGGWRGV